jgi:hypothetical protein
MTQLTTTVNYWNSIAFESDCEPSFMAWTAAGAVTK